MLISVHKNYIRLKYYLQQMYIYHHEEQKIKNNTMTFKYVMQGHPEGKLIILLVIVQY